MKISVVIPCYKSSKTIRGVVKDICDTILGHSCEYEVILINDCSPDNTFSVISELCRDNIRIKGVNLARNFGQHSALMAGLRLATGDIVVCLDDDGQTPPSEMFRLIDQLVSYDVAVARYPEKQHSLLRNLGSYINDMMTCYLLDKPKDLRFMSYFACRRFVVDEAVRYTGPYPYVIGLILRITKSIVNVDMPHKKREIGRSGYTLKKLFSLWLNGFTAFSVKPLRMATFLGFVTAVLGFGFGLFTVICRLLNPDMVLGYSSLMAVLLFIGGMLMLILGLTGEYIGRIYISLNQAPQYVIRETINIGSENSATISQ